MGQRNSTLAQRYKGLNVKTITQGASIVTVYGGGDYNEKGVPPGIAKLLDTNTAIASVDPVTYGVIKSYFLSKGTTSRNASAMVLLILDAAKLQNTTPMQLLEDFKNPKLALTNTTLYNLNILSDDTTSNVGTASIKKNCKSYSRQVRSFSCPPPITYADYTGTGGSSFGGQATVIVSIVEEYIGTGSILFAGQATTVKNIIAEYVGDEGFAVNGLATTELFTAPPSSPPAYQVCPLSPDNPYPEGTSTSKSFWDFMENQINPSMWFNDNSAAVNANTALGRYDDRANPGKYVRSHNNPGGLRTSPANRYPYGSIMGGLSNNDWSAQDHGNTYGNLAGDFTIMFGFDAVSAMNSQSRIAACFESNTGSDEWILYVEANKLKFAWYDTNGTFHAPTGGIDNIHLMTQPSVCVVTRDNSVVAGGITFTTYQADGVITTATADNNIDFPKRTNSQYFKMKWPTGIYTYGRLDLTNFTMVNRKITAAEQREFADWIRFARRVDNPHSINTYYDSNLYKSGIISYLTFNQDNASTLIDEETESWEGMTLNGAADSASNKYPLALPANLGGGTGQIISPTSFFTNDQLGTPYFDVAWNHFYNIEFSIAGVQSSNGNHRTIISKWANDPLNNYIKLELTAANELVFTFQDYRVSNTAVNQEHSWVIAKLGEYGSALFETDAWQTVHLRITSGILLSINNVIVFNSNSTALGNVPYFWKYGYDNPSYATTSQIGGGTGSWELGLAHMTFSSVYPYARDLTAAGGTSTSLLTSGYGHNFAEDVMTSWKLSNDGDFYDYPYSFWAALGNVAHRNTVATDGWYYTLLDQPGTNAPDGGVNDQDITYAQDRSTIGYEALLPPQIGRWGINLDGTANTVVKDPSSTPSAGSITGPNFTIICLFARTASGINQTLMGKWGTNFSEAQWIITTSSGDADVLQFSIMQDDNTQQIAAIVPNLTASGVVADGAWHSLLIQGNATEITARIDSIPELPVDTSTWSGTWRQSTNTASKFEIGGTSTASRYWSGKIAGVVILNDAITDCEAADIEQTFLLGYAPA